MFKKIVYKLIQILRQDGGNNFLSKTVPDKIDIFEGKYYNIIFTIFRTSQLWPYSDTKQSLLNKLVFCLLYYTSTITLVIPQIVSLTNLDIYDFIHACAIIFFHILAMCKYTAVLVNKLKVKALFDKILLDWQTISVEKERNLLVNNCNSGLMFRNLYLIFVSLGWMYISGIQYLPLAAEISFGIKNVTRVFKNTGNYLVDLGKNEDIIRYFHFSIISFFNTVIFVSIDFFLIMTVSHISGLFEILNYKIKIVGKKFKNKNKSCPSSGLENIFKDLRLNVIFHVEILKNVVLLESTLTYSIITVQLLCLGMLPMTLFIVYDLGITHPMLSMHALLFSFAFLSEVFFINSLGQIILHQSGKIYNSVYFSNWYELPVECQKFLRITMTRSLLPSKISAGKLTILSLEAFVTIVQTIFYYFTVLLSLF